MFEVTVEDTFAAGHYLRNYKGKCENPHGHNYKVRVTLDASGSHRGDDELFDMMKENGVKIALYHPVRFADIPPLKRRDLRNGGGTWPTSRTPT